jgi:hypothetical protein
MCIKTNLTVRPQLAQPHARDCHPAIAVARIKATRFLSFTEPNAAAACHVWNLAHNDCSPLCSFTTPEHQHVDG